MSKGLIKNFQNIICLKEIGKNKRYIVRLMAEE